MNENSGEHFITKMPVTPEVRGEVYAAIIFAILASIYILSTPKIPAVLTPTPLVVVRATSEREIVHGDTTKKQVIFTFDGGEGNQSADLILQTLAKHHAIGSFFLTGKFIEHNPDLVRLMVAEGNEIYSHTYDHPHLPTLTDEEISQEFKKMATVLKDVAHVSPQPYFRAPYGDRDDRVLGVAFKEGYQSVYWTVDARDWMESQGETARDVENRILQNVAPGTIYLMHFGDTITGAVLDDVFTKIESQGYKLASLKEGLRSEGSTAENETATVLGAVLQPNLYEGP
jgi:peptidoglycan-N-acetylmuramic acid deacetylase